MVANLPHVSVFSIWDVKKGHMKNIEDDTYLRIYVCLLYIILFRNIFDLATWAMFIL